MPNLPFAPLQEPLKGSTNTSTRIISSGFSSSQQTPGASLKDPANQSRKFFPVTGKTPKPTDSEALDRGNSQLGWDIPAAVSSKKQNTNSYSPLRA